MTEPVTTPTASTARLAANRANAQRSTGPRTEDGKRRSSLNALRAGLTGQTVILPSDDLQNYAAFTKRLIDAYEPVGAREQDLAYTIAAERWRLHRVRTLENAMLGSAVMEESGDFDVTVERQPDPASAEPQSPVPDSGEAEAVHATLAQARKLLEHHRAFLNLSLYEQRIYRVIEKASAKLEQLQAGRKSSASAPAEGPSAVPSPQPPVPTEAPTADPNETQASESPEIGFAFASPEFQPETASPVSFDAVLAQTLPLTPLELATLTSETRKIFSM
ncbi:MAG: hypothetical protein JO336_18980 [Acidobacteriia bacterium]|nr:hypothetical protein [Terriglobia bacterium]MBV8903200.1 hypothetical protein [Terriglobia bacterium]